MNDQAQRLRELAREREQAGGVRPAATSRQPAESAFTRSVADTPDLPDSRCRSIAVTSGKGGVGKTNLSLFLSITLAAGKKKVLLFDADLGLANVHILLGISPRFNIGHVVAGECTLDDVVCSGPGGIDVVPGASGLEELANIDRGRLELLQHEFARLESRYDYMIIDTGAGIGTVVTQFAARADIALLVMTPEPTSLADAYAMVKVLNEKGASRIGVLVNMATSDREGAETFDRLSALVLKFLKRPVAMYGTIPLDRQVGSHVRRQRVMVLENPNNVFAGRIQAIARRIAGLPAVRRPGFFTRMFKGTGQ